MTWGTWWLDQLFGVIVGLIIGLPLSLLICLFIDDRWPHKPKQVL